jgi:two-component system sensor histidine kinase YesM
VGELAKDFNIMVAHIKDLMQRNAREQELKRKNELMALQNQITPHFLYNTLDSVIWMAEGKQYDNVIQTVAALARLLRLSISRGEELISVQDEIEHVRSFLTIQKLRYRDKLDFDIDLDERVRNYPIPKVILQPLVENAVYHGIKNKEEPGRVTVSGSLHDGSIVLAVEDDGVGMSAEQRASILAAPADSGNTEDGVPPEGGGAWQAEQRSADTGRGESRDPGEAGAGTRVFGRLSTRRPRVGVRNVHERIQLYFGRDYGLSFHAREAGGTLVRVTLPLLERESNGAEHEGR